MECTLAPATSAPSAAAACGATHAHGVVIIIKKNSTHTHAQKTMHHLRNELATDLVSRNFTPGGPNGERCRRGGAGRWGVNTGAPLLDLSPLSLQGVTEPQGLAFLSNDAVML